MTSPECTHAEVEQMMSPEHVSHICKQYTKIQPSEIAVSPTALHVNLTSRADLVAALILSHIHQHLQRTFKKNIICNAVQKSSERFSTGSQIYDILW